MGLRIQGQNDVGNITVQGVGNTQFCTVEITLPFPTLHILPFLFQSDFIPLYLSPQNEIDFPFGEKVVGFISNSSKLLFIPIIDSPFLFSVCTTHSFIKLGPSRVHMYARWVLI